MKYYLGLFLLLISLIPSFSLAANQNFYYGPNVTLQGVIVKLTFPGRPNYESIKKGDEKETGPYLILDKAIDTKLPQKENHIDEPKQNVKLIQLIVLNNDDWKYMKNGNYVNITGNLSSAITAHHHARVLLSVEKINLISTKPVSKQTLNELTNEDKQFTPIENQSLK